MPSDRDVTPPAKKPAPSANRPPTKKEDVPVKPKMTFQPPPSLIKPAMKVPYAKHTTPVVRAMQKARDESRQPQSKSRSIRKVATTARTSQSGDGDRVKRGSVVEWQPPDDLAGLSGGTKSSSSDVSSSAGEEVVKQEVKVKPLDEDHLAADRLMDELDVRFKPTLESLGWRDGEDDDGEREDWSLR